jgi:release factor glutamine methyltransferase
VNSPLPSAPKVDKALEQARREFKQFGSGSLESQDLPQALFLQYLALIRRAATGEPLAYLTGTREFFGLEFFVSPDVLIPRPETELLVETALKWLSDRRKITASSMNTICAVDIGTGCGCIAATLAFLEPGLRVLATDVSFRALTLAARNLAAHGVSNRVRLLQADLLTPLRGPIDLLCANLPYISAAALAALPVARYEPRIALDGGPDGLRLIARALEQSAPLLAEGGLALFEIEETQGEAVWDLAGKHFPQTKLTIEKDLSGKDRLLRIQT